jgi:hypothetical protein
MRTFALMAVLLAGAAFAAAAEDGCDCDKKEKVEVEKVEVKKVEINCPESDQPPAPRRIRDHFRIGVVGTSEVAAQDNVFDYIPAAIRNTDLFPGLYFELKFRHFGIGVTCLGRFTNNDSSLPCDQRIWYLDALGTIDLRYHFLTGAFLDPFVEVGLGAAGRAMIYPSGGDCEADMLAASIFAQAGAGLGLNFNRFHVGAKFAYRFYQDAIPCVDLPAYPVSVFEASLFAGFSLF